MTNELFIMLGDATKTGKTEAMHVWDSRPSVKVVDRRIEYFGDWVRNVRVVHLVLNDDQTAYVISREC